MFNFFHIPNERIRCLITETPKGTRKIEIYQGKKRLGCVVYCIKPYHVVRAVQDLKKMYNFNDGDVRVISKETNNVRFRN